MGDESVDAIITDPPYSSGGAFRGDRMQSTTTKYVQTGQFTQFGNFSGDNRDQRSYLAWCSLWLSDCLRVARPGSPCCVFTDWRQLPVTTDALQSGGFVWRGIAAWDKTEAARPVRGRFRNQCEYLAWGSRGPMREDGPCLPGAWRVSVGSSEKHHVAGKPDGLMAQVVLIAPVDGVILDPFCGSGTTLRAALDNGRRAIGIEIEERYCEIAAKRLAQGVLFT
ncbi:MAG: site-specific DNA-methyltransferase [Rhodocyclaceae bacterium]|nr:MAG: site-specific DNA-methyltransferase [Rhodocyclaceae bacterium]